MRPHPPLFDDEFLLDHLGVSGARHLSSSPRHGAWRMTRSSDDLLLKVFPSGEQVRYLRELALLFEVRHVHLMALDRWGRVESPAGPVFWYTAEFVPGGDVADALRDGRWPDTDRLSRFVGAMAEVLADLHRRSIVHCDVKPANIALRDGDWTDPVLLDPGVARFAASDPPDGAPVGTTPYMAPEQVRREPATPASDMFALGIVAYRLVSRGRHPFVDRHERISHREADERMRRGPLRRSAGELGPLVDGLLAHDPLDRPAAADVVELVGSRRAD